MTVPRPPLRIAFAGGGTGGHLFPGLAVARALADAHPEAELCFFGSGRPIQRRQVPRYGLPYEVLPAVPRPRGLTGWPRFLLGNFRSYRRARRIVRERGFRMIVGLGGYGAAPLARAAGKMGVPVVLLEQNSIPGRANRYLARWATAVCAAFQQSRRYFPAGTRVELTGNPVREEILRARQCSPDWAEFGLDPEKRTLLVLGGSQGAHNVNLAMAALAERLASFRDRWQLVHQTGPLDTDPVRGAYAGAGVTAHVAPFFDDMASVYAMADLAVARAGATSIAEFACVGLPAIFMPYPHAADDHQTCNAREVVEAGGAAIVPDRSDPRVNAEALWPELSPLLADPSLLAPRAAAFRRLAQPDAAARIVRLMEEALGL